MNKETYFSDGRLEIIILGPMRKGENRNNETIKNAVISILNQQELEKRIEEKGIGQIEVTFPEEWLDNIIQEGVFNKLDTADLVILNITPTKDKSLSSPNVFYELAIVHSLGIPYIVIIEEGQKTPFYAKLGRTYRFDTETLDSLKQCLQQPLSDFILENSGADFTSSPISRFYEDLPIVDISAAVGLATGYYMNFMRRVLRDNGIRRENKDKMKHFIYVRPDDVIASYPSQDSKMRKILSEAGFELVGESIQGVPSDDFGRIWINHVNGVICDMPRMVFPLKISPRLMSLRRRSTRGMKSSTEKKKALVRQVSEKLLDRLESVIRYHIQHETDSIDESMLHFSNFEELPELVSRLIR